MRIADANAVDGEPVAPAKLNSRYVARRICVEREAIFVVRGRVGSMIERGADFQVSLPKFTLDIHENSSNVPDREALMQNGPCDVGQAWLLLAD